jgi:acetolactate synthase-1/2/3 large subunit
MSYPVEARVDSMVASALKRRGVPYVFGIPGGGSSIDLIEACGREGIPFVLAQHETSAAMMALVCGSLTGSCGVSLSIMGPGATAMAGGASYAYWERYPLLCLTECYGSAQAPMMSLQKIDHARLFNVFSKSSVALDAGDPGRQIEDAIALAETERPGPVHVDLPIDVMGREGPAASAANPNVAATASAQPSGDLDAISDRINKAGRPLLVVGPAVLRQGAEGELLRLAEKLQLAVLVTSKARGVIPEDHPLFAGVVTGVYGEKTLEGQIVYRSDLVVAVGLDRMELLSPWAYPQPLIALDAIEVPEEETVGRPLLRAYGPLPELLRSVTGALRTRQVWQASDLQAFWSDSLRDLAATSGDLNAASLLSRAREMAPADAILTTETGIYNAVNLFVWKVTGPLSYFGSCGANIMGFSLPAAMAASLVRPAQKTVALVGDGGFLMRAPELETAARLKLAPVIIVFNDGTLGLIRVKQQAKEYARTGVDLAPTDFVRLAESFGGRGWQVRTLDEFDAAFKSALSSDRLAVIDARLDPDLYASHLGTIRGS